LGNSKASANRSASSKLNYASPPPPFPFWLKDNSMEETFQDQITREDILEAIAALDRGEPHDFGPSTFYDVLEGGTRYPLKAVVGLAARRALGRPLGPKLMGR